MSTPGELIPWGLNIYKGSITENTPKGFQSKDHDPFHLYSKSVTLANNETLDLPASIKGFAVVGDGSDGAVFQVQSDGTVVEIASTGNAGTGGGGNIQFGDVDGGNDSTQIVNVSGSEMDLEVVMFYKDVSSN